MSDDAVPHLKRIERRTTQYPLPAGADILVRPGQGVGPDAPLARVPRVPVIEPYAADLNAAPTDAIHALSIRDGAHVRGGELIARRRNGLRTYVLTAITNGIVAVRPDAGFYTLSPIVPTDITARYGGMVQTVTSEMIVVSSVIECVRCAFTSPQATAEGAFVTLRDPQQQMDGATADVVLVPHLADLSLLRAYARAGVTLIVAGTVADTVAWELLTARTRSGQSLTRTPHIAVIAGPGNATEGVHVAAMVRAWDNRSVWLETRGGAPTLCTEAPFGRRAQPEAPLPDRVILRDPAHWGIAASVAPTAPESIPIPGLTRTVIIPGAGYTVIPAQNAVTSLDGSYE